MAGMLVLIVTWTVEVLAADGVTKQEHALLTRLAGYPET